LTPLSFSTLSSSTIIVFQVPVFNCVPLHLDFPASL
jgi:hypothetical protein